MSMFLIIKLSFLLILVNTFCLLVANSLENHCVSDDRIPHSLDPQNYNIKLTISEKFPVKYFHGEFYGEFVPSSDISSLKFHAKYMTFESIQVIVKSTNWFLSHCHDNITGNLIINLNDTIQMDDFGVSIKVSIKYRGEMSSEPNGLYNLQYVSDELESQYLVATKLKPIHAREVFPCSDYPIYKVRTAISIIHPANMTVISNMEENSSAPIDNSTLWQTDFETTPVMPSYAITFVISNLNSIEQSNGISLYRAFGRNVTRLEFALDVLVKARHAIFAYLSNFGLPILKFDLVAVPTDAEITSDDSYGLGIFREHDITFDESKTPTLGKIAIAVRIAEFVAHQYIGNLVSPQAWNSSWFFDGIARWMAYDTVEKLYPEYDMDQYFTVFEYQKALMIDRDIQEIPMSYWYESADDIIHSQILKEKSAAFFRMMENISGKDKFQETIRQYILNKRNNYDTGGDFIEELWNILKIPHSSWYAFNWIYESGYPILTSFCDKETIHLSQTSILGDDYGIDNWWIPFTIIARFADKTVSYAGNIIAGEVDIEAELKICARNEYFKWFIMNAEKTGLYRTNYEWINWVPLYANLHTIHEIFDISTRARLLDDAFRLTQIGIIENYNVVVNIAIYLRNETEFSPWVTGSYFFEHLRQLFEDHKDNHKSMHFIRTITRKFFDTNGLDKKENDLPMLKATRGYVANWACRSGNKNCICEVRKLFREYLRRDREIEPDVKAIVLCNGVRDAARDDLDSMLRTILSSRDLIERNELALALGCSKDMEFLIKFLKSIFDINRPVNHYDHERNRLIANIVDKGSAVLWASMEILQNISYSEKLVFDGSNSRLLFTLRKISKLIFKQDQSDLFNLVLENIENLISSEEIIFMQQTVKDNLAYAAKHREALVNLIENYNNVYTDIDDGISEIICEIDEIDSKGCCGCNNKNAALSHQFNWSVTLPSLLFIFLKPF